MSDFVVTPQWALVLAVQHGGPDAMSRVLKRGLRHEHLGEASDPAAKAFKLFETYFERGRLPTLQETALRTGAAVPSDVDASAYDLDAAIDHMAEAVMFRDLREGVGSALKIMRSDPAGGREKLLSVYESTGAWLKKEDLRGTNSPEWIAEMYQKFVKASQRKPGELLGLPYPWQCWNDASQGLQPGEMTVILAKRKVGKTWLTFIIADHIVKTAMKPGEKILYISPEMSESLVMSRSTAVNLRLDYARFRRGRLETAERKRLEELSKRAYDAQRPEIVWVYGRDLPNRDVRDIEALVREIQPVLVIVDSMYVLGDKNAKIYQRVLGTIERLALSLAADLRVPVLCTSQLSGSTGKREVKADADNAAYAKAIGDYADVVMGAFVPPESQDSRIIRGMEAREFEPLDFRIRFDLEQMRFDEIEVIEDDDEEDGGGARGSGRSGRPDDDAITY